MPPQPPRATLSPHCHVSTVFFTQEEQRSSSAASGLVSFGVSEEEITINDSMPLAPSDVEEWACSGEEPKAHTLTQSTRPSSDSELIHVLCSAAFPKSIVS